MNRQALLLPLALLLLLCANLHLCCRVCIGGVWDSKLYSLSSLLRAKHAAHETTQGSPAYASVWCFRCRRRGETVGA